MKRMRRSIIASLAAGALFLGLAGPVAAQDQDGLVNVWIGEIRILEDVRVALAAQVVAHICGLTVGPVVVLGRAVDRSGGEEVFCEADLGAVTIEQN